MRAATEIDGSTVANWDICKIKIMKGIINLCVRVYKRNSSKDFTNNFY